MAGVGSFFDVRGASLVIDRVRSSRRLEIGLELGFLFGLTDATPDNAFKFNLEYECGLGGGTTRLPTMGTRTRMVTTTERGADWHPRSRAIEDIDLARWREGPMVEAASCASLGR